MSAAPDIDVVMEVLKTGGPASIFALLWWLERQERKELSDKLYEAGREFVVAMSEVKAAMTTLGNIFNGSGRS